MTDHGTAPPGGLGAPTNAPTPPAPRPRLTRRTDDKVIAGVCSGIGAYLGVDPVLVRIAVVVLSLAGLSGVVLYIIGWVVIPEARPGEPVPPPPTGNSGRMAGGAILLVLAILLMGSGPGGWGGRTWWPGPGLFLPILLLGAGVYLLLRDTSGDPTPGAPAAPPPAPGLGGSAFTGGTPTADHTADDGPGASDIDGTSGDDGEPSAATAPTESVAAGAGGGDYYQGPWSGAYRYPPPPPAPYQREPDRQSLTWPTIGILLVGFGLVSILANTGAVDPSPLTILAGALVIVGAALIVAAWYGRARGLIAVGILLTVLLTIGTAADVPARGGVGERLYQPTSTAEIREEYRLFAGEMRIDLRDIDDLAPGDEIELEASVAMGQIIVLVPDDATVVVDARVGAGEVLTFGRMANGLDVDRHEERTGEGESPPVIVLELRIGAGQLEVR